MNPLLMHRSRIIVTTLIAALVGAALTFITGPHTAKLSSTTTGDTSLTADVRSVIGSDRGYRSLSVGRFTDGQVTFAGLGRDAPTPKTPFELGSITKTFTGMLLADAVQRGDLTLDDPLATHLSELQGTQVGGVTLRELATHTSGLPPLPKGLLIKSLGGALANNNPYQLSAAELIDRAKTTETLTRGNYLYSNMGMSLLGHAEARAAGVADWATLARTRLLEPLGMSNTRFVVAADQIPDDSSTGHHANGWPAPHWYGAAFVPAGSSTWTTAEDLMIFTRAVLEEKAPGMKALDPIQPIPGGSIGLAWHLRPGEPGDAAGADTGSSKNPLTWHNGGTGGFRTILALDRERNQAVLILGNSTRDTDRAGFRLAATSPGDAATPLSAPEPDLLSTLPGTAVGLSLLIGLVRAAFGARHRLGVIIAGVSAVAGILILLAHGPWSIVPACLWGAIVAIMVVCAVSAARRSRGLPTMPDRGRARTWVSFGSSILMFGLAIWSM